MRNSKAQTATEYLIILAVVIIIALIVLGVLGGIPGIGGGASDSQNKIILQTGDVGVSGYKQDTTETSFFLKNNQPNRIKITSAYVGEKKCALYPTNQTLKAGQEKEIICLGFDSNGDGDSFSYEFNISYVDTQTDAEYVFESDAQLRGQIAAGSELHTGATVCYDTTLNDGTTVACSDATALDDAGYDGTAKSFTDLGDNVLLDDHTGLYWTTNETGDVTRAVAITTCDGKFSTVDLLIGDCQQ